MDAPKPNGQDWTIREQIIREEAVGISLQFELTEDGPILRISGDSIPVGTLEIGFTKDGLYGYGEVGVVCDRQPTWIRAPASPGPYGPRLQRG